MVFWEDDWVAYAGLEKWEGGQAWWLRWGDICDPEDKLILEMMWP